MSILENKGKFLETVSGRSEQERDQGKKIQDGHQVLFKEARIEGWATISMFLFFPDRVIWLSGGVGKGPVCSSGTGGECFFLKLLFISMGLHLAVWLHSQVPGLSDRSCKK